jgi:hypothetical protein
MDDAALAEWLALREAADAASRSETVTNAVVSALDRHDQLRVLDLATGTGANVRFLMPRLRNSRQRWLTLDRSGVLLDNIPRRMSEAGYDVAPRSNGWEIRGNGVSCLIEPKVIELATIPDAEVLESPHLVTASALLDLVSDSWLRSLAARCLDMRAAALFAITYNGHSSCSPPEPEDRLVLELFNRHQRTDKGLGGPAAGPAAVAAVVRAFDETGYLVVREASDWNIGPEDVSFQRELIDGWAHAASEIDPGSALTIARWRERRLTHVADGRSHLVVGHDDVGAWLPASRIESRYGDEQ